jgi:hypothetical protein
MSASVNDWLCRCLSPHKAGTLLLVEGTKVVAPPAVNNDSSREEGQIPLPQLTKKLPTIPTTDTADWSDNAYVKTCVGFIESTLRPLESDPHRFHRVAVAIANEILGDLGSEDSIVDCERNLIAVKE